VSAVKEEQAGGSATDRVLTVICDALGVSELQEGLTAASISVRDFDLAIKDLRCWVKHFYDQSSIPELTRIKALQRCCSFLVKVVGLAWDDYHVVYPPPPSKGKADEYARDARHETEEERAERRLGWLQLIKACLQLFDWLCVKGRESFLFNEQCGRENLAFVIARCNMALSQFRAPPEQTQLQLPLEDLAFNSSKNKQTQAQRKYDMFPFTEIGAILQNILY